MKANLGCGNRYMQGWINVDISDKDIYGNIIKVDKKHNLDKFPYPFKDNTFDEVLMRHTLEHLKDIDKAVQEMIRIAKKGGKIRIVVPHYTFYGAFRDPTHKHFFSYDSINYFKGKCKVISQRLQYSHNKILDFFGSPLINIMPRIYERFFCYIFPCQDILWEIKK
jgi:ubiquinone/menaquinone biosynthesis C-methylase UbiE